MKTKNQELNLKKKTCEVYQNKVIMPLLGSNFLCCTLKRENMKRKHCCGFIWNCADSLTYESKRWFWKFNFILRFPVVYSLL